MTTQQQPTAPTGTPRANLQLANRVRVARSRVKAELMAAPDAQTSRELAAQHIENPAKTLGTMTIGQLVASCRRTGPLIADRLLRRAGVTPERRLRTLTVRERMAVAAVLRGGAR